MKRRFGILGVLVMLTAAALVGGRWLIAGHERREALRLARAGQFAEARPLLEKALARDGGDLEALTELALGTYAEGAAAAEDYLTQWCELRPREVRPHRLRMDWRHRQGRAARASSERLRLLELAVADGLRVLELEPERDEARRELAWLLLNVGRFAEAERACRASLSRAPDDGWLLYLLARARHGQGDRPEAEGLLDDVLSRTAPQPELLLFRATLHREAGRHDRAIPLLRQALALEGCPRKECLYQLGLALASAGKQDEARRALAELDLENLQEALTNDGLPNTPAMRLQIAQAMLGAGKNEEARALLQALVKEDPNNAGARRLLAAFDKEKK